MDHHASKALVAWRSLGLLVLAIDCRCRDVGTNHHISELQVDGHAAFIAEAAPETESSGPVMRRDSRPHAADIETLDVALPHGILRELAMLGGTPSPDAAPPLPGQGESLYGNTPSPSAMAAPPLPGQGEWWGPTPAPSLQQKVYYGSLIFFGGILVGVLSAAGIFLWYEHSRRKLQQEKKDMFKKDKEQVEVSAEAQEEDTGLGLENKEIDLIDEGMISKSQEGGLGGTGEVTRIPDHAMRSSTLAPPVESKAKPVKQSYRAARSQRKKTEPTQEKEDAAEATAAEDPQLGTPDPGNSPLTLADPAASASTLELPTESKAKSREVKEGGYRAARSQRKKGPASSTAPASEVEKSEGDFAC